MIFIRGGEKCEEMVPIEDYVPVLILPELGPPGLLDGLEHAGGMASGDFRVVTHRLTEVKGPEHVPYLLSKYRADDVEVPFEINHDDFRRLIAKIAHCHAIQFYGFDGFERFNLIDSILGRTDNHFEFVGGDGRHDIHETWEKDSAHVVGFRRFNSVEVYVRVKLWNRSRTPEYIAAVGTLRRRYAAFLDFHQLP